MKRDKFVGYCLQTKLIWKAIVFITGLKFISFFSFRNK